MSVERNLPLVRDRKQAILTGDPTRVAEQTKAGKKTARARIALLLDPASFVEMDALNADAGVVTGYGTIEGNPVYVYAQDYAIHGGAVGRAHAQKIVKAMRMAEKTGAPIIGLLDTAGAKLDEGVEAMNAYAEIAAQAARLSGVVPQIAVVVGPCGGVAACIAEIADFVIQSKSGQLFVNGPRLVGAVTGKNPDMETIAGCEASSKSGVAHKVAESEEDAIAIVRKLTAMLPANNLDEALLPETDDINRQIPTFNAIDTVEDIRDVIQGICDNGDYIELYAEFAASMVTALGRIGGRTVGFIANQPSKDQGRLSVYGCRKAAHFVGFLDSFGIPVISLVDTMGVKVNANPQGELARAGAALLFALAETTAPRVSLVVGNAIGLGYVTMASRGSADVVYAWPGAVISALSPAVAVQLNEGDALNAANDPAAKRAELEQAYCDNVADGIHAATIGMVDDVIEPAATRQMLASALEMLSGKRDSLPAKKHGNLPL